ncbi:6288_t:CDS:2, partial [Acaulospora colombiana]
GFAYSNISNPEIITNNEWSGRIDQYKTNTVLQYDSSGKHVEEWGYPALAKPPTANVDNSKRPVELFKLYLGDIPEEEKPPLPDGLTYDKAIIDYLHELAEAAAIYCMKYFKDEVANIIRRKFLICDVGGGTVDLTVRKLVGGKRLSELTECTGDYCGGSYVDQEFVKYVGRKVGNMDDYKNIELDLEEVCPALKQYVEGANRMKLEKDEWIMEFDFETVKAMFDPVIGKIIRLIRAQLDASGSLSAMFLVGGFSESKYLQSRVKEEFSKNIRYISVPPQPITSILRGAVEYGLNVQIIKNRVLKYTYGIRCSYNARILNSFFRMATRGTKVDNDIRIKFDVYYTKKHNGDYTTDEGMNLLGTFTIDCPDPELGLRRPIDFSLRFGESEIIATAVNRTNGRSYNCSLALDFV